MVFKQRALLSLGCSVEALMAAGLPGVLFLKGLNGRHHLELTGRNRKKKKKDGAEVGE